MASLLWAPAIVLVVLGQHESGHSSVQPPGSSLLLSLCELCGAAPSLARRSVEQGCTPACSLTAIPQPCCDMPEAQFGRGELAKVGFVLAYFEAFLFSGSQSL